MRERKRHARASAGGVRRREVDAGPSEEEEGAPGDLCCDGERVGRGVTASKFREAGAEGRSCVNRGWGAS